MKKELKESAALSYRQGSLHVYRMEGMNWAKSEIARMIKRKDVKGNLADVIKGADVFIGLSSKGVLNRQTVASMAKGPIVFALVNPVPEIHPDMAKKAGAMVVATGRSDFPNQVNN
jgi:malate dehydrogenase (oxaloacetate-decarboxylating)